MNVSDIPYSTVRKIVKELFESYGKGIEVTKNCIKTELLKTGFDEETANRLLGAVGENDPFIKAQQILEDEKTRISYIKSSFPFVEPVTVNLDRNKKKAH